MILRVDLFFFKLLSLKLTVCAPENGWLEDEFSFWGVAYFQGRTASYKTET